MDAFMFINGDGLRRLLPPSDLFEIFAFCAQSRSNPLGAESPPISGFVRRNLQDTTLIPRFDDKHLGHSREFRSDIINERGYWMWVGWDFRLQGFADLESPPTPTDGM